ncbi:serine/arginine repetitive matrix protein 2 [Streptomyces tanashiensis]|uniref:Serine/arginine repetitive matrix protein 2 n=1 Tax=Streptomyces tanashiensis TaxID=67367 RepID=A0ABY6QY52_9ACTN|nr:serine/arginine repetitive matrix protein 2 [Streptomyces tanashiensis]UZX22150.1 serine/arginine repetitive matrix protein 2 [Streptomyces tanashiensis]
MSGHGGGPAGGARWNDETQSWESGGSGSGPVASPGGGPVAPPPPPPPAYAPEFTPEYVPESGGWQYPAPPAPAPRPRSRAALAAGVAAAVIAAGSVSAWMVWGRGDANGPAAGPAASVSAPPAPSGTEEPTSGTPSDTASETPTESSTPTSTSTDGVPPPGYRVQEDLKGFTIAVPDGWDRTESDQGVFFNAPDGRSLVQVFVIQEAGITPYEALRGASEDGRSNKPGYEEIGLERVTGEAGAPADSAELVYAYDRDGGRRKVVDRAFTAADGNQYAILAAGPEADWPKQREVLRVALTFFTPGAH